MTTSSGRATVVLKDHRIYVCDATDLSGRRLTFTGRLRVRDLTGERYYKTTTRTVPLGQLRSIYWHDGRGER
jgi:hypothetical protein